MRRIYISLFAVITVLVLLVVWRSEVFSPAPPDITFTISPDPINRNAPYEIAWSAPDAQSVDLKLMVMDTKTYNTWYPVPDEGPYSNINTYDQSASGTRKIMLPDVIRYPTIRYRIEATYADGDVETVDTGEFALACFPTWFDASICSTYETFTTPAAFQAYEGGYILWNAQQRRFYVLFDYEKTGRVGWVTYADIWQADEPAASDEVHERFALLWASEPDVQRLGQPLSDAQPYTLQMQFIPDARYGMFDAYAVSLPDGHLRLVTGGGPLVESGPSWIIQ